ncbi:MAG TPA: hypothetical protein HPP87_07225 [Planctomycetes bacterium]|nr:hypothetical protein [Planctomycetota bacterium]
MNLFSRIAIGTANWGREYNGVKVSEKEIGKILGYAQCNGIDTLDCATAYGWDWTRANSFFNVVVKIRWHDDREKVEATHPYCIMRHHVEDGEFFGPTYEGRWGISCYQPRDLNVNADPDVIQVPYSLYDRRFDEVIERFKGEIHVRSIFLRGKIIADGIPPEECVKFCLANPHIDKIIIGVDSVDQLQRSLNFIHLWNPLEKHDEQLLDPRKW